MVHTAEDSWISVPSPPVQSLDDADDDASHEGGAVGNNSQSFLEENHMRLRLMEMESSFLPEPSTIDVAMAGSLKSGSARDDTLLVGVIPDTPRQTHATDLNVGSDPRGSDRQEDEEKEDEETEAEEAADVRGTRKYEHSEAMLTDGIVESSPAAAPAVRNELKKLTLNYDGDNHNSGGRHEQSYIDGEDDAALSVALDDDSLQLPPPTDRPISARTLSPTRQEVTTAHASAVGDRRPTRPRYLSARHSSYRLSHSSVASTSTTTTSAAPMLTLVDNALASETVAHETSSHNQHDTTKPARSSSDLTLTRTFSLGSMASGVSGYSDEPLLERRTTSAVLDSGGLDPLAEEDVVSPSPSPERPAVAKTDDSRQPATPTTPTNQYADLQDNVLTDTAIAERVQNIAVPGSFARHFQEQYGSRPLSPDKRAGGGPGTPGGGFTRSGRSMTLKEQSSTIDRLSKENFDLKMRIHFLNEALSKRSEEGIQEMVSENVELKSDKLKLQKDNQSLRRKVRDLENQLKDRADRRLDRDSSIGNHDLDGSEDEDRGTTQEEEMFYLRERIEVYELEIEKLRSESISRESEKRRLAEIVKSLSGNRPVGSDAGAREERDMWKDMLDAETAAREQAEDDNKKLRDEILYMKAEMLSRPSMAGNFKPGLREQNVGSVVSQMTTSDQQTNRDATGTGSLASTLVEMELLKQENAELRKEVSAQTSMLTSRNREKERLYQEIEELKLGQRRDGSRSVTSESIFDRSASRAHVRSSSQTSDGTGASKVSESEREDLEFRNGQLRDRVSALKLENQALRAEAADYAEDLETYEQTYATEIGRAEDLIQKLCNERDQVVVERDQALQLADERENAFEDLKAEAEEELAALNEDLRQKIELCQRLDEELKNQDENLKALQAEMRSASEGIIRLEEDAQNNLQKFRKVQQELEEANGEIESLEASLVEANAKLERLTVQIESSQNEIAFLREEQDGDKIKIGDLESELKTYQLSLQSERDKSRELEQQLTEERHQREVVGSKEKQEVQRMMNEVNREASAAKEEVRKLRKSLSTQEIETNAWREKLMDLETNLRETLGDLNGSRSSLIANIMKLQKELESTALELESTRSRLDERETLLRNRDALLESHGLESRKLAELLERERQARRADKQSFEQALKSHHQASRTIIQSSSRISELEAARAQDRKKFTTLEQQFKDQLAERNTMLLTVWKRLSAMCGPDWAHSNSLINGNLPSQEVIGNILFWPGFSRNLLLAIKTLENVFCGFKNRIKAVERDLTKQYQTLEHTFSLRLKRLDRLEETARNMRAQQHSRSGSGSSPEVAQLRGENRLLKAELNLLNLNSRTRGSGAISASPGQQQSQSQPQSQPSFARHNSASTAEKATDMNHAARAAAVLTRSSTVMNPQPSSASSALSSATTLTANNAADGALVPNARSGNNPLAASGGSNLGHSGPDDSVVVSGSTGVRSGSSSNHSAGNEKWIYRLHELERRLKAEREARLLDRSGARKRLQERDAENEQLRAQLERERVARGGPNGGGRRKSTTRGMAATDTESPTTADPHSSPSRTPSAESIDVDGTPRAPAVRRTPRGRPHPRTTRSSTGTSDEGALHDGEEDYDGEELSSSEGGGQVIYVDIEV